MKQSVLWQYLLSKVTADFQTIDGMKVFLPVRLCTCLEFRLQLHVYKFDSFSKGNSVLTFICILQHIFTVLNEQQT